MEMEKEKLTMYKSFQDFLKRAGGKIQMKEKAKDKTQRDIKYKYKT